MTKVDDQKVEQAEQVDGQEQQDEAQAVPPADDWTPPTKAEWEQQQSAIARYRREKEAQEKAAKQAEQARAEQQGEWEALAKQHAEERDQIQRELDTVRQEQLIVEKATNMRFRRPDYALKLLPADVDRNDPVAVEQGLQALLADDPQLKSDGSATASTGTQPSGEAQPQSLDEQIAEAEARSDWRTAGALKAQKIAAGPAPRT